MTAMRKRDYLWVRPSPDDIRAALRDRERTGVTIADVAVVFGVRLVDVLNIMQTNPPAGGAKHDDKPA